MPNIRFVFLTFSVALCGLVRADVIDEVDQLGAVGKGSRSYDSDESHHQQSHNNNNHHHHLHRYRFGRFINYNYGGYGAFQSAEENFSHDHNDSSRQRIGTRDVGFERQLNDFIGASQRQNATVDEPLHVGDNRSDNRNEEWDGPPIVAVNVDFVEWI